MLVSEQTWELRGILAILFSKQIIKTLERFNKVNAEFKALLERG